MKIEGRLPNETGREFALRELKRNIVDLQMNPGYVIREDEILTATKLSKTPVREALLELAKLRIIEIIPQTCSRVALIDEGIIEETRYMRRALEYAVVRDLCGVITDDQVTELEQILSLAEYYAKTQGNGEMFRKYDKEFHKGLFVAAHKEMIYSVLDNYTIHSDRLRSLIGPDRAQSPEQVLEEHRNILNAIKDNQPDKATRLIDEHLTRFRTNFVKAREQYPQYFKEA